METFVGDTIILSVGAGIDISGYTDFIIKFRRPNMTVGHWVAALDPLDNTRMVYTTSPTDLNMPGDWVIQAHVEGSSLHGLWTTLTVLTPLAETSTPPTTLAPTTVLTTLAPTTLAPTT